jgi:hypothetical protein
MKRLLLVFTLAAAVMAVPATASAFSGVVLAKKPARGAFVVASRGGVVRTVRAPRRLGAVGVGWRLVFSARRLSDGTFKAGTLRVGGRARRAPLRAVVVRHRGSSYLISAGGSVLAVRALARGFSALSRSGHRAGDIVLGTVRIGRHGLETSSFHKVGHTGSLEVEGMFLGMTASGQLRLAVRHRGEVFVNVPEGFQLPKLAPGDEIELVVSVDSTTGAFTLVSVQQDDQNDDDNEGVDEDNGKIEVKGAIIDLTADSITVQSHLASPVTCGVPSGFDVSHFKVKDLVEMKCKLVDGKLMLVKLEGDDDDDDGGGDDEG